VKKHAFGDIEAMGELRPPPLENTIEEKFLRDRLLLT